MLFVFVAGCTGESYNVRVRVPAGTPADASFQLLVTRDCVDEPDPATAILSQTFSEDESSALGDLSPGRYALHVSASTPACGVVARGCETVDLQANGTGDLVVELALLDDTCIGIDGGMDAGSDPDVPDVVMDVSDVPDVPDVVEDVPSDVPEVPDVVEGCELGSYPATVQASLPLHYLRFDEAAGASMAVDTGAGASNLQFSGQMLLGQPGAFATSGTSVGFRGLRDAGAGSVDFLNNRPSHSAFSVEYWMRIEPFETVSLPLMVFTSEEYQVSGFRIGVDEEGNHFFSTRQSVPSGGSLITDPMKVDERWVHIVWVVQDGTLTLYRDGATVLEGISVAFRVGATIAGFGAIQGWSASMDVDEFAYYARALRSDEVTDHYDAAMSCR